MGTLIISTIVFIAIVFGLSFLVFKLICVLAQHKENKLPLILAGIATALVTLFTAWVSYKTYQQFVKPIMPIVEAARNQQQPVYGEKMYTDPTYGFSFTQYNGTVFGDWFNFTQAQLLVGVDLNNLLQRQKDTQAPFSGFLLIRIPQQLGEASQQMQQVITEAQGKVSSSGARVQFTSQPQPIEVGPEGTSASFISAIVYSQQVPDGMPAMLLIAVHADETYYFVGVGINDQNEAENTLKSFRFQP